MYTTLTFFILSLPTIINAQAGFSGLQISRGARPAAMADIGTAMISPESSNPAAIPIGNGRDYIFSHTSWVQNTEQENIDIILRKHSQSWGIHVLNWRSEDLEYRVGPSHNPLGSFGLYELALGLSHIRTIENNIRAGTRISLLRQGIYDHDATGWAIDFGILHFVRPKHHWAISLLNFGQITPLNRVSTQLPTQIQIGLFSSFSQNIQTVFELHKMDNSEASLHVGSAYQINKKITLRCGYQTLENRMLSLGASIMLNNWHFDYSHQPFGENLGQIHRISLRMRSGQ